MDYDDPPLAGREARRSDGIAMRGAATKSGSARQRSNVAVNRNDPARYAAGARELRSPVDGHRCQLRHRGCTVIATKVHLAVANPSSPCERPRGASSAGAGLGRTQTRSASRPAVAPARGSRVTGFAQSGLRGHARGTTHSGGVVSISCASRSRSRIEREPDEDAVTARSTTPRLRGAQPSQSVVTRA